MKIEHQKINRIASNYYANLYYGKLEDLNIKYIKLLRRRNSSNNRLRNWNYNKTKSEKTSGMDGIRNERIKHSANIIKYLSSVVFDNILKTKIIPNQWNKSLIQYNDLI